MASAAPAPAPPGVVMYPQCQPHGTFTMLTFGSSTLLHSNLGGQGGRCDANDRPADCLAGATSTGTAHNLHFAGVGEQAGQSLDLVVSNRTEYRAWNAAANGVSRSDNGDADASYFGIVNLLSPRPVGEFAHWDEDETAVVLRYQFVASATHAPITVQRTFLTFYGTRARSAPAARHLLSVESSSASLARSHDAVARH
jgi:hypothetical protein